MRLAKILITKQQMNWLAPEMDPNRSKATAKFLFNSLIVSCLYFKVIWGIQISTNELTKD